MDDTDQIFSPPTEHPEPISAAADEVGAREGDHGQNGAQTAFVAFPSTDVETFDPPNLHPEPTIGAAGEAGQRDGDHLRSETHSTVVAFPLLALQGEFLADLEKIRIANGNRIRALRDDIGLTEGPEMDAAVRLGATFDQTEAVVTNELRRALRHDAPGIAAWAKTDAGVGIGEKQLARLLAVIGHPRWRYDNKTETWLPRSVGQLWSYSGYAVVNGQAPRRQRGQQAAYNTDARMRTFLIAESCIKQTGGGDAIGLTEPISSSRRRSPFRDVYDEGRVKYAEAVHEKHECVRCGPAGHPAKVGSPLSLGHQHARALRLVAKAILRELWVAAA